MIPGRDQEKERCSHHLGECNKRRRHVDSLLSVIQPRARERIYILRANLTQPGFNFRPRPVPPQSADSPEAHAYAPLSMPASSFSGCGSSVGAPQQSEVCGTALRGSDGGVRLLRTRSPTGDPIAICDGGKVGTILFS